MISGNKGNVGKSLFCLALASVLELRGETYAILDGDGRTKDVFSIFLRKCPAKWVEFRDLDPESSTGMEAGDYQELVQTMLESNDHVIINTPDGVDNILSKWFHQTLRHTEINNCLFKLMFLISERPDGLDMMPDMMREFSFFYPVRNLHFGVPDKFTAFNLEYFERFDTVVDFPKLRDDEARMLFDYHVYPAEALQLKNKSGNFALPALERARILHWMTLVSEAISDVIDNVDVPNFKTVNVE
jgi:hypothetical protein